MTATPSETQAETSSPRPQISGLKAAFANVPESDYVRDVLALVLLIASLKLPVTSLAGQTVLASTQSLYVLTATLAGLALTLPYLTRFGIMPKGWTVARTRAVRIILAVPYIGYFLWLLVAPHLMELTHLGIGSAFAVGGAGVALAAQARSSELGPQDQDKSAQATAVLVATILAGAIALSYVTSMVFTVVQTENRASLTLVGVLFAQVSAAVFLLIPAFAVFLKRTAGWITFVLGLGIALIVFLYFGAMNGGSMPFIESLSSGVGGNAAAAVFLPLAFTLGSGTFLFPALAATVASPAFKRAAVRNSPLEQRLDLAAITLRMVTILGAIIVLVSVVYLVIFDQFPAVYDTGSGKATGQVITVLVIGLIVVAVSLAALKAFNANPAASRIAIAIALVVASLCGLIIMSAAPILGTKVVVAGHLLLFLALPIIGAYAIIGNKETREFFAQYAAQRPVPNKDAYEWVPSAQVAPVHTGYVPGQTGPIGIPNQQTAAQQSPALGGYRSQNNAQTGPVFVPQTSDQPAVEAPQVQQQPQSFGAPVSPEPAVAEPQANSLDPVQSHPETQVDEIATQTVSRQAVAELINQAAGEPATDEPVTEVLAQQPVQGHGFTREVALDPLTPAVVLAKIAEVAPELRPALAENPSTYEALLGWLSQIGDPQIDAALARRNS